MKDKDDILVKDIKELIDSLPNNDSMSHAINIMYMIRGNKNKYFKLMDKEYA